MLPESYGLRGPAWGNPYSEVRGSGVLWRFEWGARDEWLNPQRTYRDMVSKDAVLTASALVLAASALVFTAVNVRETYARKAPTEAIRTVANWEQYGRVGHRIGPEKPKVTVVVFSDYECTACKTSLPHLIAIQEEYRDDVAVVVRHYPLPGHPAARPAAAAAVCASRQGHFLDFHRGVFARTDELSPADLWTYASDAGVGDSTAFTKCMAEPATAATVDADLAAGNELGIPGTPTYLINDGIYNVFNGLEKVVEGHLRESDRWFSFRG